MTVWNRIALGFMLVAIFIMLTHLMPDDIEKWKMVVISLMFNFGVVLFMITSGGKDD